MTWIRLLPFLFVLCFTTTAEARIQRFALLVGNNRGSPEDHALRYAEADAAKIAQVLRDLGGFEPADMVLLRGEDTATMRRTLITLNDRIRSAEALPNTDTLLFVYYSGHADGRSLRLGPTRFDYRELAQLVRGSAAKFRVLVVDSCRSGTLTRVKGGQLVAPFAVGETTLGSEGMAFLTAASANEDAQESDALGGSFFTHALVSGLLGAADDNGDGAVVIDEAYRYAYDATRRATSRTFSGTQHPTFEFNVKGFGALVLTWPGRANPNRAMLVFPPGISYLLMAGSDQGQVVGEVGEFDAARSLSVPPGRYFVRGRARDHLLEGTVAVVAGQRRQIDARQLQRVAYARLVRKRAGVQRASYAGEIGFAMRRPLTLEMKPCTGALLGARRDQPSFGLSVRLGYCRSAFENPTLRARIDELELSGAVDHTWDLRKVSLVAGGGGGGRLVLQHFETLGRAPSRRSLAPFGFALAGLQVPLAGRTYAEVDGRVEVHLFRYQPTGLDEEVWRVDLAAQGAAKLGVFF